MSALTDVYNSMMGSPITHQSLYDYQNAFTSATTWTSEWATQQWKIIAGDNAPAQKALPAAPQLSENEQWLNNRVNEFCVAL